jgi:hypothetical protein
MRRARSMLRAITYACGVSPVVARNSRWKWNGLIAAASAISCKLGGASNESSISTVTRVSRRASSRPRTRFGARREVADGYVYEQVVDEFVCFEPVSGAVPQAAIRAFLFAAGFLVLPLRGGCEGHIGDCRAVRGVAHFRITAEVADDLDFIQRGHIASSIA